MRTTVNVDEAKAHLSHLLTTVQRGGDVTIVRAGRPIARLVPVEPVPNRVLGLERGEIWISDDFDDPMPDAHIGE